MGANMYLEKNLVVGPFQCNCRLIVCPKTGHGALVDPGDQAADILRAISQINSSRSNPIEIKYLLHTHGHLDHVGAARPVKEKLKDSKIALHQADEPIYLALREQGQMFGLQYEDPLPVDHYLQDGEEFKVGELNFSVLHTPGHSPGSVCLRLHEDSTLGVSETLYSGDTLFQGSVGRTDLWGGNQDQMFKNIKNRILTLDGDTRVCPGHGPETRIGIEKRENPFLK